MKAFFKEKSDLQVLVQTGNKTAMTYITKWGKPNPLNAIKLPSISGNGKKHNNKSRSYTRSPKSYSRMGIEASFGFEQLDVEPRIVSATDLHEMAPKAPCSSVRCSSPSMEQHQGLCLSPVLSKKDEKGKDDDSINRPYLDNTTMVRSSPRDVCTGPSSPPSPQTLIAPDGQIHPLLQNESLQLLGLVVSE